MKPSGTSALRVSVAVCVACSLVGNTALAQVFGEIDTLAGFQVLPWFIDVDQDSLDDALIVSGEQVLVRINHADSLFQAAQGDTIFSAATVLADVPFGGRVLMIDRIDPLDGIDMLVHIVEDSLLLLYSGLGQPNLPETLDTHFGVDTITDFGYAHRGRPALKVGRFDADAMPDIFMNKFGGFGKWYRNRGDGSYEQETVATNYGQPYDREGDGDMDLFQGDNIGNALSVSVTYSTVTDTVLGLPPVPLTFSSLTGYTGQMEVADIDGNGAEDLVIAGAIILRMPGPTNELLCCQDSVDGFRFRKALDLDCDPDLEVLDANSQAGYIGFTVQEYTGTGVLRIALADTSMSVADITTADVNADGRTDLIYQDPTDSVVRIRWNVAEPPDVQLVLDTHLLALDTVVFLSGGIPPGGIYTGTGIWGDSLHTDIAGEGLLTITYVFQVPFTGCMGSATDTVDITIGMSEADEAGRLIVFPNPAGREAMITSPVRMIGTLIVRDQRGRDCIRLPHAALGQDRPLSVSVGHLNAGLYQVSLVPEDAGPALSARIMVVH